jgi:hypothetical protein
VVKVAAGSLVMIDKWCSSFAENDEFLLDQLTMIIGSSSPVSARIFLNPAIDILGRTIQDYQRVDMCDRRDVSRLTIMARDSIQDKEVVLQKADTIKEQGNNLSGDREMLILKQESALEHAMNKVTFIGRIHRGALGI